MSPETIPLHIFGKALTASIEIKCLVAVAASLPSAPHHCCVTATRQWHVTAGVHPAEHDTRGRHNGDHTGEGAVVIVSPLTRKLSSR